MTAAIAESAETTTTAATREPARRSATTSSMTLVDASYDAEKAKAERLAAAAQRRAAARTRDLTALLRDRPDLAGVHAPADFAVDAVRWCA
jgi:hypothetical protein